MLLSRRRPKRGQARLVGLREWVWVTLHLEAKARARTRCPTSPNRGYILHVLPNHRAHPYARARRGCSGLPTNSRRVRGVQVPRHVAAGVVLLARPPTQGDRGAPGRSPGRVSKAAGRPVWVHIRSRRARPWPGYRPPTPALRSRTAARRHAVNSRLAAPTWRRLGRPVPSRTRSWRASRLRAVAVSTAVATPTRGTLLSRKRPKRGQARVVGLREWVWMTLRCPTSRSFRRRSSPSVLFTPRGRAPSRLARDSRMNR
ncbi:hypothetical protein ENSA7_48240 [Enhygromyxa salina]|uniref:Uncharacterized protein n=1 Tax=Enhygromyxa salina TaxID=215803 RepID=A0A2S9YIY8_9BACT|nr:hypothetical protein ENSA7_48240 [Enhygromyxa salina]